MKDKFIIGGGISGLIFKYYNPDFTIIESKDIGGQIKFEFSQTVFLFDDEHTRNFLKSLDIPFEVKTLRIRYFANGQIKNSATAKENSKYIGKKFAHAKFPYQAIVDEHLQPRQAEDANYLNCDVNLVLEKLSSNIEVIKQKVILVDTKNQTITLQNYKKFHYQHLVSTIPAPDFRYISYNFDTDNKFHYLPGTFVISKDLPQNVKMYFDKFDILYYCDDDMIFNRIWSQGDKYLYEIPGDWSETECKYYLEEQGIEVEKHFIRRTNVVFTEKVKQPKNVTFIGRLATWNGNEFISDSIERAAAFSKGQQNAPKQ